MNNQKTYPGSPVCARFVQRQDTGERIIDEEGITMRQYFAARAMQSICIHLVQYGHTEQEVAKRAVGMADALIEELNK